MPIAVFVNRLFAVVVSKRGGTCKNNSKHNYGDVYKRQGVFGTTQTCVDNATYTTFDVLVRPEYAVFVDGTDELAHHYSALDVYKRQV